MRSRIAFALAAVVLAWPASPAASPLDWITGFLTDAATRLARDLREGADLLKASADETRVVVHRVKARPEGCSHAYRVQLGANAALLVWCRSRDGRSVVSGYSTTSHLPAVGVPRTWILEKGDDEPLYLELTRTAGKPAVSRVW